MAYVVQFLPSAVKALAHLEASTQRRIVARVEALATNPRPAGVKALQGSEAGYRLRLVLVGEVGHRREIYRR